MFSKLFLRKLCCNKIINIFIRALLKPFSFFINDDQLIRIPVSGTVSFCLPNSGNKKVFLETDCHDLGSRMLYWKGIFALEPDAVGVFLQLLKFADTVLDVGANIGYYSLVAAVDNRQRRVYAFEPVPRVFNRLIRNKQINNLSNLQAYSMAATTYDGEITLYVPPEERPVAASTLKGYRENVKAISVPATRLDSFVLENNIKKVDLMKIDTEATEHLVLEGAVNILERDEPIIICEVLQGRTETFLHSILDLLRFCPS